MSNKYIVHILSIHSIETRMDGDRVMAKDEWYNVNTGESGYDWVDVTGWKLSEVKAWLGY